MKKLLSFVLSMALFLSNVNVSFANTEEYPLKSNIYNKEDYSLENNISNKKMLETYKNLITTKNDKLVRMNNRKNYYSYTSNDIIKENHVENNYNFEKDLVNTFSEFENMESVYREQNNGIFTNIIKSKSSDNYGILEIDESKQDIFISLNGKSYKIFNEGENVYLCDADNNIIPIIYSSNESNHTISTSTYKNSQQSHKFGKYIGPRYKTNKVLFKVVDIISLATGGAAYVLENPILGAISFTLSTGSTIGSSLYQTLYIKYWQAHSLSDPSYIKEKCNYYKYNNYTGFIKTTYNYFYTTRPY